MTQETEHEQRKRIAEMEKDVSGFDDLQGISSPPILKKASNH